MNASTKWDSATLSGGTYRLQDTKVFRTVSQIMLRVTATTTVSVSTGVIVMDAGSTTSVVLGAGVFLASAIPEGWNIEQVDAFAPVVASPPGVTGVDIAAFDGGNPNGVVSATRPTIAAGRNGGGIWARDLTATGSADWYELAQQSDLDRLRALSAYGSRVEAQNAVVPSFVMIISVLSSGHVVTYRRGSSTDPGAIWTNGGAVKWEVSGPPTPEHMKDGNINTDDFTSAIYNCLNKYHECNLRGRTYLVKELEIPSGSRLTGVSYTRSILKLFPSSNTWLCGSTSWKNNLTTGDQYINIQHVGFDGDKSTNTSSIGLAFIRSNRVQINNCIFKNSSGKGLVEAFYGRDGVTRYNGPCGGAYTWNIIENCDNYGFHADGVYVSETSKGAADGFFMFNVVRNCGTIGVEGIRIERAAGWKINDNQIYDCGTDCIVIASIGRAHICRNNIEVNGNYANYGDVVSGLKIINLAGDSIKDSIIKDNVFSMLGDSINNTSASGIGGAKDGVTYCAICFDNTVISSSVSYGSNSIFDAGLGTDCQAYYFGYDKSENSPENCVFTPDAVGVPIAVGHEMFINPFTFDMG